MIWERVKGVGAIIALPPSVQLSSAYGYDVFISYYPELGYKFLPFGIIQASLILRIPDYRRLPVAFHLIEILDKFLSLGIIQASLILHIPDYRRLPVAFHLIKILDKFLPFDIIQASLILRSLNRNFALSFDKILD